MRRPRIWLRTGVGRVVSYFLQGLLLIAPAVVTVYAIFFVFDFFDTGVNNLFEKLFHFRLPVLVGIVALFLFITFVGFIGSLVFVQPILHLFDLMLEKTPVVKDIYSSLKDFFNAFISNKKKFNKAVMFELGKDSGVFKLGFITQEDLTDMGIKDKVAVYCPLSYNLSGLLYIVNADKVEVLDEVAAGDLMKFIVSGGVTEIEDETHHQNPQ